VVRNWPDKARFSFSSALLLYILYIFLRFWTFSEVESSSIILQDLVFIIPAIVLIALSFADGFKKFLQAAGVILFIVGGITIISTSLVWPVSNHFFIYSLVATILYGYAFLKLRFISATFTGWFLAIAYLVTSLGISEGYFNAVLYPFVTVILTNLIGMLICYSFERHSRKNYLLEKLLKSEKSACIELKNEYHQKDQDSTDLIKFKEGLEENKASLEEANLSLAINLKIIVNDCLE